MSPRIERLDSASSAMSVRPPLPTCGSLVRRVTFCVHHHPFGVPYTTHSRISEESGAPLSSATAPFLDFTRLIVTSLDCPRPYCRLLRVVALDASFSRPYFSSCAPQDSVPLSSGCHSRSTFVTLLYVASDIRHCRNCPLLPCSPLRLRDHPMCLSACTPLCVYITCSCVNLAEGGCWA